MTILWTLRKKIFLGYGIALLLTVFVFAWAIINLSRLGRASDAILKENYRSILAAENMIDAIERQDSAILMVFLGSDSLGLRQFRENESQFFQWLGRAKDNITIEGEAEIIQDIDTGYADYLAGFSRGISPDQSVPRGGSEIYQSKIFPLFIKVRDACIHLRNINQETMFAASDRARSIASRAIWSMGITAAVAILIVLSFSLMLSNLLVKPLRQIISAANKIAGGDYEVQVPIASSDEVGSLAGEFNAMAKKLKGYHQLNVEQIVAEKMKTEAILRSIDDGIVVVNADFKIVSMNPMAAKVLNSTVEEALERHFLEIVKSENLFGYVRQAMESGKAPKIEEEENIITVKHNATARHYLFSIIPVQSKPGAIPAVVLLLRDVTRLKELDRLKSEFVMTASHQLRTPLTSIGMSIDLLRENALPKLNEDQRQLLAAAHEDVENLTSLVNDLLDLSRIEAGKIEMEFTGIPLRMLFEKAVSVLKSQATERSVALTYKLDDGLPEVKADANKITWVLTNLIANALRYTDKDGHISLFAERIGQSVTISVRDDGAGIPYEYQLLVFEKFIQVKDDRAAGGSGLGLAICKEIVRAHGGAIWVESVPAEGSTFTFSLPIAE